MNKVLGIHHITAIAGDPQKNVNFYTGALGLRFIKKTVNFDDPFTYHFYYGNESGDPGTVLTFFPWGKDAIAGRKGNGQVTTISYSIPKASLDFWKERLHKNQIDFSVYKKFDEDVILFSDHDGFESELIPCEDVRSGYDLIDVPAEHSIRGFHSATFSLPSKDKTENVMTDFLGFEKIAEDENRIRYHSNEGKPGMLIDILVLPDNISGRMGTGAIHHIAFRARDDEHQLEFQKELKNGGLFVTDVMDRNYFHSIYFREPGNILFEIATDKPGFLIDESKENLGTHLKLPPWEEARRNVIENALTKIELPLK